MKKICQYPTCTHTLCSAPKAQYSTSLIKNTIIYSLKHATFLGFKYKDFLYFLMQSIVRTVHPQFKAILQPSQYHNFNLKYYTCIILTIHTNTLTVDNCACSLSNDNQHWATGKKCTQGTRTRVWPSFRQTKFSCMSTEFVLNGISVMRAIITLECQHHCFSFMDYTV